MAFSRSTLQRIGGANSDAGSMWMYRTADTAATVNTADYFLDAINEINVGDVILSMSATGGTPVLTITYCNANDGTTIDVVDGTAISATDTD
ncbi:MAG: hypothetical protein GY829_12485 [Gammaproteobacteria bacterium]|nr:hypothetical protein [Gammaproteobacteria bacterium]